MPITTSIFSFPFLHPQFRWPPGNPRILQGWCDIVMSELPYPFSITLAVNAYQPCESNFPQHIHNYQASINSFQSKPCPSTSIPYLSTQLSNITFLAFIYRITYFPKSVNQKSRPATVTCDRPTSSYSLSLSWYSPFRATKPYITSMECVVKILLS